MRVYLFLYLGDPTVGEHEAFQTFIERSKKLCQAWEVTLLLMTKISSSKKARTDTVASFNQRVKLGMKTRFNKTVYEGYIRDTNYRRNDSRVMVSRFCF